MLIKHASEIKYDCHAVMGRIKQPCEKKSNLKARWAYADDVNILGGIHTVKENAEALVVATKEIGLEVNADKTKYMVMSREQTAGLSHYEV